MADWNLSLASKLVFLFFLIGGSIMAGYGARRAGFPDHHARRLILAVILGPYPITGLLVLWNMDLTVRHSVLPLIGFFLMGAGAFAGVLLARFLRLDARQAGALAMACGASNLGFTMGGAVNFVLFGETGLAIASMYTVFWTFGIVLLLYPIARSYGAAEKQPVWRVIADNFWDLRSLPLLGVSAGLFLNFTGIPRPEIIDRGHIVTILIIGGAFIAFFTTGLRLHFSRLTGQFPLYGFVAGVKFVVLPLIAGVILVLLHVSGWGLPSPSNKVVLVQASTAVGVYAVLISSLFSLDDQMAGLLFFTNTIIYLVVVLPMVALFLG